MAVFLHEFVQFLGKLAPDLPRDLSKLQAIIEQHTALTKRHAAWCQAFDDLLEQAPAATETEIATMQLWRTMIDMMLGLNIALGEMAWDGKIESFRKALNFAEIVVEKQSRGRHMASGPRTISTQISGPHLPGMSPRGHLEELQCCNSVDSSPLSEVDYCQTISSWMPVFSLDLGIIVPLYVIVSRCRDPSIRRRGLQLLASCNRREGIWDSTLSARVAERIIAIEEEGAMSHPVLYASQIPEYARIRDLATTFGSDRQGVIKYTKSVACVGPNDKYVEILEW